MVELFLIVLMLAIFCGSLLAALFVVRFWDLRHQLPWPPQRRSRRRSLFK